MGCDPKWRGGYFRIATMEQMAIFMLKQGCKNDEIGRTTLYFGGSKISGKKWRGHRVHGRQDAPPRSMPSSSAEGHPTADPEPARSGSFCTILIMIMLLLRAERRS